MIDYREEILMANRSNPNMSKYPNWIKSATPAQDIDVSISFLINPTFYIGNPNSFTDLNKPEFNIPIEASSKLSTDKWVSISTLSKHPENIEIVIEYYRQVINLAKSNHKKFKEVAHYFWIRLALFGHEVEISFPWYDKFSEVRSFLEWLESPSSNSTFLDIEQGWQVEGFIQGNILYLQESDSDSEEIHLTISTALAPLAVKASKSIKKTESIIKSLTEALGDDVWTSYKSEANFVNVR